MPPSHLRRIKAAAYGILPPIPAPYVAFFGGFGDATASLYGPDGSWVADRATLAIADSSPFFGQLIHADPAGTVGPDSLLLLPQPWVIAVWDVAGAQVLRRASFDGELLCPLWHDGWVWWVELSVEEAGYRLSLLRARANLAAPEVVGSALRAREDWPPGSASDDPYQGPIRRAWATSQRYTTTLRIEWGDGSIAENRTIAFTWAGALALDVLGVPFGVGVNPGIGEGVGTPGIAHPASGSTLSLAAMYGTSDPEAPLSSIDHAGVYEDLWPASMDTALADGEPHEAVQSLNLSPGGTEVVAYSFHTTTFRQPGGVETGTLLRGQIGGSPAELPVEPHPTLGVLPVAMFARE